ncbi:hypothetical protein QUF75_05675 [Desulfococcaceae bacterium HSG7]|nr:hypothetical protein [Desulfococcaceae bacterium HSG7]
MRTILCRIGWMTEYRGHGRIYFGNMNFDHEGEGYGEAWNFKPRDDGFVRGFVMLTAKYRIGARQGEYTGTIDINKLGARIRDDYIDAITVIFFAPNPDDHDNNYVVGWYENAIVYRSWIEDKDKKQPYSFEVTPNNTFLIPENQRDIEIISAQYARANNIPGSYPGMSNVFFCNSNPKYVKGIIKKLRKIKKVCQAS